MDIQFALYRTGRTISRWILRDVRREDERGIDFETMSIDSREEQHEQPAALPP
jgi:hypothetical protein